MTFHFYSLWAITKIRDILREGFATVSPNETWGRRGQPHCHVTFFEQNFTTKSQKGRFFDNCHVTQEGGGGTVQCPQMLNERGDP